MRLDKRLTRIETALATRVRADGFHVVEAVPLGDERAGGRPPGLYRDGPDGSLAGLLVFDPARGEPEVLEERLAPWGLLITCGPDVIEPPEYPA